MRRTRRPVLVAGDFNTTPSETDLYAKIKNVWADLTATYREECKCGTSIDKKGPRREWIEHHQEPRSVWSRFD